MSTDNTRLRRALSASAVAVVLSCGSIAGAAVASAHVHADANDPVRGDYAVVTFRVPNESDTGSPTTRLTVNLPALTSVSTEALPGWSATLDRDTAAGTVRSITWSAAPGTGIQRDQFEMFAVNVKLPDTDSVSFPATQTYADGTVVHWDQAPLPSGGEPEHPAPELDLRSAAEAGHQDHDDHGKSHEGAPSATPQAPAENSGLRADNVARALGGGALLLAALGVGVGLVRRRA
jgi:uncharacterized protein YcnI